MMRTARQVRAAVVGWPGEDGVVQTDRPRDGVVVTIGNFDGVHRGHVAVIAAARALARTDPVVAVTFDPHPLLVLRPDRAPAILTPLPEKIRLLRAAGADDVLVLPFDQSLAAVDPADFVRDVLVRRLVARAVVVGENFRFGYRAAGDLALLTRLGAELGFDVVPAPLALLSDRSRVSSSVIRSDLAAGEVASAAAALGRPYRLFGLVVHGDHRGRELGYPTANLNVTDGVAGPVAVPADGIYAVRLLRAADRGAPPGSGLPATLSVGTNPTFNGVERRVEANVLDVAELDLYGERVALDVIARERPTVRFDSAEALIDQMALDTALTRQLLGVTTDPDLRSGRPGPGRW
jgi:riboflavin kinase/FMN adenylyltransferase